MDLVDDPHQSALILYQPFDGRFATIQVGNRHAIKPILPTIMKHSLNADGVDSWKLFHLIVPKAIDVVLIDYRTQFFSNKLKETGIGINSFNI